MGKVLIAGLLFVVGCGGGGSADCQPRAAGNYLVTATPTATNGCALSTTQAVSMAGGAPDPACTTTLNTETPDMCSVSIDFTCVRDTGSSSFQETVNWNEAGTAASGIQTFTFYALDGTVCVSTLRLDVTKL